MIENVCIHLSEKNVGFTLLAEKSSEQDSRNRASVNLIIENLEKVVDEQGVN